MRITCICAPVLILCGLSVLLLGLPYAVIADGAPDYPSLAKDSWQRNDFAQAKGYYQQIWRNRGEVDNTPAQHKLYEGVLMRLGECCLQLGEYDKSREWFQKVISTYPTDQKRCAEARIWIARSICREADRGEVKKVEAKTVLESIVKDYPEKRRRCADALLKKARMDMRPGRYGSAVETLQRLIKDYPDKRKVCKYAKFLLVTALDNDLRIDDSLSQLDVMLASDEFTGKEKGNLLLKKANVQLRASRYKDCSETWQKLLSDNPTSQVVCRRANYALVQALCETGSDPDKALSLIDEMGKSRLRGEQSHRSQLMLWRGQCYLSKGEHAKAEECFTNVITGFPERHFMVSEAYFHRAHVRTYGLKDYKGAASDVGKVTAPYLKHYAQGELYYVQGQYESAAAEFTKVIESLPAKRVPATEPRRAFRRLSLCYSKLGKTAESDDALRRLAEYEAAHSLKSEVQ